MMRAAVAAVVLGACSFAVPRVVAPPRGTHLHCGGRWLAPIADTLGFGAFGFVGVAIAAESSYYNNGDWKISAGVLAVAAVFAASAVHGYLEVDRCHDRNDEADGHLQSAERQREQRNAAWELMKGAMQAARAGDCAQTASTGERVRAIDADFYATVFARDIAITRCLDEQQHDRQHDAGGE